GRMRVWGKVGRAPTFTIRLPRAQNATGGAEQPSSAVPSGARTVLVVEDEPDVRDLIRDILQFEQYAVLEASDREAALAIVKRHEGPIRSEEHTSELQSRVDLVCRLLLEKK